MDKVLLSKKTDDWSTPKEIYDYFMNKGYVVPCPLGVADLGINCLDFGYINKELYVNPPTSENCTKAFKEIFGSKCSIIGRLKFGESKNSAPFLSCFVVFDGLNRIKNCDKKRYFINFRYFFISL